MHFLTAEQVGDLAQAITWPAIKAAGHGATPHWRTERPECALLVRFAAYTGPRAAEIAGLKVGRVDFLRSAVEVAESATEVNGQLLHGPTKNYQRHTVPMPAFLRDDLAAQLGIARTAQPIPSSLAPRADLCDNNFCRRQFKPAVLGAVLPTTVRFHDLRHSFTGFLIARGHIPGPSWNGWGTRPSRSCSRHLRSPPSRDRRMLHERVGRPWAGSS